MIYGSCHTTALSISSQPQHLTLVLLLPSRDVISLYLRTSCHPKCHSSSIMLCTSLLGCAGIVLLLCCPHSVIHLTANKAHNTLTWNNYSWFKHSSCLFQMDVCIAACTFAFAPNNTMHLPTYYWLISCCLSFTHQVASISSCKHWSEHSIPCCCQQGHSPCPLDNTGTNFAILPFHDRSIEK